ANPVHGANMCGEPGWETVDQIWLPALNGTHLSTWSCQLDGKKLTSTNSTNSNPIPALIAAAVCRSSVPRPNASIPHTARNSPPPITARSTPGSPRLAFRCLPDRMAWPMKNDRNEATSPVTRATTVNTTPLAASTAPRRGCTVSDVRIIPVEYSDVTVSAPSTTMISWPRIRPTRLCWVGSKNGPRTSPGRDAAATQASAPMPTVTTIRASSVQ